MDVKEAARRPIPSRPTIYTNFSSFSELLAGAINTVPSNKSTNSPVTAIRPKTIRFIIPAVTNANQAETCSAEKILNNESKSVIYKPLAKVVSRTFSMLADLGNSNLSLQQSLAHIEAHVQTSNHNNYNLITSNHQKTHEPSNKHLPNTKDDQKYTSATANSDRVSYDGYKWRKYGQKQAKGSKFPRSYYKCSHPNCPVTKKVERTLNGKIAEIVYKGEHNHLKPQPIKQNTNSSQGFVSDGNLEDSKRNNENFEEKIEAHSSYLGKAVLNCDPVPESCEEAGADVPKTKKRKIGTEAGISGKRVEEAQVIVPHHPTDCEIIGDGFRWRKYGQKVVKGNPYPRPKCAAPTVLYIRPFLADAAIALRRRSVGRSLC